MNAFDKFMRGRYGSDVLSVVTLAVSLIASLLCLFFDLWFIAFLPIVPIVWVIYRTLSKNIEARERENRRLTSVFEPFRRRRALKAAMERDRKTHVYFKCPECSGTVRLPIGMGKIKVTCPHCKKSYEKTT